MKLTRVGIVEVEVYLPKLYAQHKDLESYYSGKGKFQKGSGQEEVSICSLLEDPVSMSMTALHRLLKRKDLCYSDIGMIEVESKSHNDCFNSFKSYIEEQFSDSKNPRDEKTPHIETTLGSTSALLKCLSWAERNSSDGKFGVVLCSDMPMMENLDFISRGFGGAGAVCLLIGKEPLLTFEKIKYHHMSSTDHFYLGSNNRVSFVDSSSSIMLYIVAFLQCVYELFKLHKKEQSEFNPMSHENLYALYCPYPALAHKAFFYLCLIFEEICESHVLESKYNRVVGLLNNPEPDDEILKMDMTTYHGVSRTSRHLIESGFEFAKKVGNCYAASLLFCLLSFIAEFDVSDLLDKRVLLFSHDPASLSSIYSLTISGGKKDELTALHNQLKKQYRALYKREKITPNLFESMKNNRKSSRDFIVDSGAKSIEELIDHDTFYIGFIDNSGRKTYKYFK